MYIETPRLLITDFSMEMCKAVHLNSLDEDNRRFVPDEVFETIGEAQETVAFLMEVAQTAEGPFVYPVLLRENGISIGHVQAVSVDDGWEIGYHIAKPHTGRGYASEAVAAFLPVIAEKLQIREIMGVVLEDNAASCRVLEKCGFCPFFQGTDVYQGAMRPLRKYRYQLS